MFGDCALVDLDRVPRFSDGMYQHIEQYGEATHRATADAVGLAPARR